MRLSERTPAGDQQFLGDAGHLQTDHGDGGYVQSFKETPLSRTTNNTVQKLCHSKSNTLSGAPAPPLRLPQEDLEESPPRGF